MKQKGSTNIILIVLVIFLLGIVGYLVLNKEIKSPEVVIVPTPKPKPDPIKKTTGEEITKKVGEKEGSFLIKKINLNSVDGIWWELQPVYRVDDLGVSRTLHKGDDIGFGCDGISEKLTSIDFSGQKVTFTKIVGPVPFGGCPI